MQDSLLNTRISVLKVANLNPTREREFRKTNLLNKATVAEKLWSPKCAPLETVMIVQSGAMTAIGALN